MSEIIVTIAPDGGVQVAVKGVAGPSCVDLTDAIERAVGVVRNKTQTQEYRQRPQVQDRTKEVGR